MAFRQGDVHLAVILSEPEMIKEYPDGKWFKCINPANDFKFE